MDRPSTSKARGICKYYQSARGCFAGDQCKFLHGDPKADSSKGAAIRLTPYDQSKTCRYFYNGFCKHGDKCWFRHVPPPQHIETAVEVDPSDEVCSICFEKPALYGLLAGCSHVFCMTCLKEWRDPRPKSVDVVHSGVHKKCPMCRTTSKFITPSSLFLNHDDPRKEQTISAYKDSMARVPCRYFVQSKAKKPFCPFGKDCFYQHLNDDGAPYVFSDGVDESMQRAYLYRERRTLDVTDDILGDIFAGVNDGRFRSPFDVVDRFLDESRFNHFSTAFAELFQGMVLQNSDTQEAPTVNSDESRPIVNWSLDSSPNPAGGVRVTLNRLVHMRGDDLTEDMHPLEAINAPRQISRRNPSPSRPAGTNNDIEGEGAGSDDFVPSLNGVGDSDASDQEWSEDDNEINSDPDPDSQNHHTPPSAPPAQVSSIIDAVTPYSPRFSRGRRRLFPRAILIPRLDNSTSRSHQETIVEGATGNVNEATLSTPARLNELDDPPPLDSVSNSEDDGYEEQDEDPEDECEAQSYSDDMHAVLSTNSDNEAPPLERIDQVSLFQGINVSKAQNLGSDTSPSSRAFTPSGVAVGDIAYVAPPEDGDDEQHDVSMTPPFTTDGRGRVIGASNEDNIDSSDGRSFLSRVFDVIS